MTRRGASPAGFDWTRRSLAMDEYSSDIAFTPIVKEIQTRRGSRDTYRYMEECGSWKTTVTPELAAYLAERDSCYLATTNGQGQPYIQHRGGPKGFLHVLDEHTIAFADFSGNKQYITTGNLLENDRAFIFLMDYGNRRRIKLWGRARVVEDDEALVAQLMPRNYRARAVQAILFTLSAWDVNCHQHIPVKFSASLVEASLGQLKSRIAELEAENAELRAALNGAANNPSS
jgi:uncharacterized protein